MKTDHTTHMQKNNRNSSIELLRILSIFSIVLCHFATHGKFDFSAQPITVPRLWWNFIEMGGNFGVDVFILIAGYFFIDNKNISFNFKKTMKLWGQVFFYSVSIFIVSFAFGHGSFSLKSIVKTVFPITFSNWWFASTYFMLFLLHPYINKLLYTLNKKQFRKLLILLLVCWYIIPTFTNSNFQSNQLLEFVTLYILAGYIKIYGFYDKLKCRHWLILSCIFTLITYLSCVFLMVLGTKIAVFSKVTLYFYGRNKLPTFLSALFIFMTFIKMKPFYSKTINKIASATFGVYLLHDSSTFRSFFWIDLFKNSSFQNSNWIILYSIGVCILVYAVCTLIDLVRQKLFEQPYTNLLQKYQVEISKFISSVYNKAESFIFKEN